jgi:Fe-S-cluster containining protein
MNKSEIEQIRIYIKKHNIKAQNHIGLSVKTVDVMCPFLKTGEGKETVCTIYPVRPQICRKWKCNSAKMEMKYTNETRVNTRKEFFGDGKCFDIEIASMLKILGMDKY